ncbi:MAG: sulfite exporter TauE/SafE family protein, partial [Burkholderiales bacterium]|nr:sulfite exporter TauE/SafE family protein [Opitutaceae bacterium]
MELAAASTPAAAFVAGLVTSLHCAGMCGPLACLLGGTSSASAKASADASTVQSVYHGARLLGYATLGAAAAGLGAAPA